MVCGAAFRRTRKRGPVRERCDSCLRSNRIKRVEKARECALPGCDVPLNTDPFGRGRPRKFCCTAHRQRFYWQKRAAAQQGPEPAFLGTEQAPASL